MPGWGGDNSIVFAQGIDLSGDAIVTNKLGTDGFIYMGNSSGFAQAGLPTSSDGSVTITPGAGTLDLSVAAGDDAVLTITGDTGGALSPTAGNINLLGLGETVISGSGSTLSALSPRCSEFIVDPTLNNGTHQTIAAAFAAASSGDTVFIRPGSYTEDTTPPAGISVEAFGGLNAARVTITGKLTLTDADLTSFRNITFLTNADVIGDIAGSSICRPQFYNCAFFLNDGDGFTINNASASPSFRECFFHQSGNTLDYFNITSANQVAFDICRFFNTGTAGTSTIASGTVTMRFCTYEGHLFTTSATGIYILLKATRGGSSTNSTFLTTAGTGSSILEDCKIFSGASAAISIGSGTTITASGLIIDSTNTAPISGAGTFVSGPVDFSNTGKTITVTSTTIRNTAAGGITFDNGTNYLANYVEGTWTPEITGSTGAPSITYTTQLGKYTRIGNVVSIKFKIVINTTSGGSGNVRINTLPITPSNDSMDNNGTVRYSGINLDATTVQLTCLAPANTAQIHLIQNVDDGSEIAVALSTLSAGDMIQGNLNYWV